MSYRVDQILLARTMAARLSEEHGEDFHRGLTPEQITEEWCAVGWTDPGMVMNEVGAHCPDAQMAKDFREAGIPLIDAAQTGLLRRYYDGEVSLEQAQREAGTDPIVHLRDLAKRREQAEAEVDEVRRLAPAVAKAARDAGHPVAWIAEAYGVSRQAAYSLLD